MINNREIIAAIEAIPIRLEQVAAEVRAGLTEFKGTTRLQGARVVPIGAAGGRDLASTGEGRLVGWSLRATGAHATVVLRDSRGAATGDKIAFIDLPASALEPVTETVWLGTGGISFTEGLFAEVITTGDVQGALYLGAVD